MSQRQLGNRDEPVRTRKSSMKDKSKSKSGDIKEAFKSQMAAANSSVKEATNSLNKSSKATTIKGANATGAIDQSERNEQTENPSLLAKDTSEIAIQDASCALEDNHDNTQNKIDSVTATVDSSKEEILEAIRELTAKFDTLDNTVNHPKNGIGAKIINLTLRTDTLYSDINGAVDGLKVNMSKVKGDTESNKAEVGHIKQAQDRMSKMIAENKRLSRDLVLTQGLVQKYSQKIQMLEKKVLDLT